MFLCVRYGPGYSLRITWEHPNAATSLNNLAMLYASQGKYPEAEPLLKRALGIRERHLGPEHPRTRTVQANYATLLQRMKRDKDHPEDS